MDDSRVIREVLKDILSGSEIEVVGEARNGEEAIELTGKLKPDIITMDVMMPVMDGLTSVEHIMAEQPTPILIFASSVNRKDVNIAFEAIQKGALDVVEKPESLSPDDFNQLRDVLVQKIRLLSNIKVIRHIKGRRRNKVAELSYLPKKADAVKPGAKVLAVGASTGGPKAVMSIFNTLPAEFPVGALLVQHIGSNFTSGFVDWLNRDTALLVKTAEEGEKVEPGKVLVAPGDVHMEVENERIRFSNGPLVNNCRPSVDVMFKSVAREYGNQAMAVLLTGMGRDGAEGMMAIKQRNGATLVQDEKSSVIFGMPKSAVELGAADKIVTLKEIPDEIVKLVGGTHNGQNTGS